jgi:hypothetical protein
LNIYNDGDTTIYGMFDIPLFFLFSFSSVEQYWHSCHPVYTFDDGCLIHLITSLLSAFLHTTLWGLTTD